MPTTSTVETSKYVKTRGYSENRASACMGMPAEKKTSTISCCAARRTHTSLHSSLRNPKREEY